MRLISLFSLLLISTSLAAGVKPLKIAIIDTGLDITDSRFTSHICSEGHFNFSNNNTDVKDNHGHGTHVAGLIQKYAGEGNYCFLIYKYYSDMNTGHENLVNEVNSIKSAIKNGASIVNISGGGPEFEESEYLAIRENKKVKFVVAAGNENQDIDDIRNYYYPASYNLPNVIVVGNVDKDGKRTTSSNYGKRVTATEIGTNVWSTLPGGWFRKNEGSMSGTSQATAIHTGKIVAEQLK